MSTRARRGWQSVPVARDIKGTRGARLSTTSSSERMIEPSSDSARMRERDRSSSPGVPPWRAAPANCCRRRGSPRRCHRRASSRRALKFSAFAPACPAGRPVLSWMRRTYCSGPSEAEVLRVVGAPRRPRVARAVLAGQQRRATAEADAASSGARSSRSPQIGVDPVAHGFPGCVGRNVSHRSVSARSGQVRPRSESIRSPRNPERGIRAAHSRRAGLVRTKTHHARGVRLQQHERAAERDERARGRAASPRVSARARSAAGTSSRARHSRASATNSAYASAQRAGREQPFFRRRIVHAAQRRVERDGRRLRERVLR